MKSMKTGFRWELEGLINKFNKENGSDTPDFILADYLHDCLDAWDKGIRAREKWYGRPCSEIPLTSTHNGCNLKTDADFSSTTRLSSVNEMSR